MQVSGRQLLDSCGKVFVVRGVEQILGNELPPGNDWLALIEEIAATGANAVRIYRVGGLVAGSRHTVLLHFAEFVFSGAGQRRST